MAQETTTKEKTDMASTRLNKPMVAKYLEGQIKCRGVEIKLQNEQTAFYATVFLQSILCVNGMPKRRS